MALIEKLIVDEALKWEGEEEIEGNMGFKNPVFQEKMKGVGHEKGQAWCSYFAELVWKEAFKQYKPELVDRLDELFHAGAVNTYNNFKKATDFKSGLSPYWGSLIVWQRYYIDNDGKLTADWRGHIGIVIDPVVPNPSQMVAERKTFNIVTMEGNTNEAGGREGIQVARKKRTVSYDVRKGLVLRGFIYPE